MLDAFEGPLDLLLYLIRKANVDILDIPMAPLTRQYLDYIEKHAGHQSGTGRRLSGDGGDADRDQVAHAVAATQAGPDDEAEDPRAELVRRLMEYEQMKIAGQPERTAAGRA
jgi:segregation and condensation protein A